MVRASMRVCGIAVLVTGCGGSGSGGDDGAGGMGAAAGSAGAGASSGAGGAAGGGGGEPSAVYPDPDWSTAAPDEEGFDASLLDAAAAEAEGLTSNCFVVTRRGRIVGEWYWNGWDAASEQGVFSVTKSFASTLVGIAQDQGLLDIDEPASKYIDEWVGTDSESVTIKNLISNDSGRQWSFDVDYVQMAFGVDDKTQFAIDLGQDQPPGTYWEYNNSAIQTLDRVLSEATGADLQQFASDNLFDPLGMASTLGQDSSGNYLMFSDLSASCRDLARFGYLFLREGRWADDRQIVSADWVAEATRPSTDLNVAYGYLWWLNRDGHWVQPSAPNRLEGDGQLIPGAPESAFAAIGLGGQVIGVDPESDVVFTRIGQSGSDLSGSSVVVDLTTAVQAALAE